MQRYQSRQLSAIILTALSVEYKAVRAHLRDLHEEVIQKTGTICERGVFEVQNQQWNVAILEIGLGNTGAALETERAINYFKPDIVLFVGIAEGLKEVYVGDVVVVTKVYGYEFGKANLVFQPRPEIESSTYSLVKRARIEAKRSDWLKWMEKSDESLPLSPPRVCVAPIIAGTNIAKSPLLNIYQSLQIGYGDAVAIEIGEPSFLQAIQAYQSIDTLIIRGIASRIGDRSDIKYNAQIAARNASAFAYGLLANLIIESKYDQNALQGSFAQSLTTDGTDAIEIFYAYAGADEKFAQQLQTHLAMLKRHKVITDWHAGRITKGDRYELMKYLNRSQIILLLISPDFMSSDYSDEIGMKAMKRCRTNKASVIPVLLRPTDWQDAAFGTLQPLPKDNKTVVEFSDRDRAFLQISDEIRNVAEKLKAIPSP